MIMRTLDSPGPCGAAHRRGPAHSPDGATRRPALDLGSLVLRLHHELGYRTTGIDCSPQRSRARRRPQHRPRTQPRAGLVVPGHHHRQRHRPCAPCLCPLTCRLVYRSIDDQPALLDRNRRILRPGGVFLAVTKIVARHTTTTPALHELGISPLDIELPTTGWPCVRSADLDVLRCYVPRP